MHSSRHLEKTSLILTCFQCHGFRCNGERRDAWTIFSATDVSREEAVELGQPTVAKYVGESMGHQGDVVEDDYGISVKAESESS